MATYGSSEGGARAALAVSLLLAMAVSPRPVDAQPPADLQQSLRASRVLAAELGLVLSGAHGATRAARPELRDGPDSELPGGGAGATPAAAGGLEDAFCAILGEDVWRSPDDGRDPASSPATCSPETLASAEWQDVVERQTGLQQAFDLAPDLYTEAVDDLLTDVFVTVVCPNDCDDADTLRRWWDEHGAKALALLDRLGRGAISLSISLPEIVTKNSQDTTIRGLQFIMQREEGRLMVRYLSEVDPGRFGVLQPPSEAERVFRAIKKIPAWIQNETSRRMSRRIEEMSAEAPGVVLLQEALESLPEEASAVEHLGTTFRQRRQRFSQIVAFGQAVDDLNGCRLPRRVVAESLSLTSENVENAREGFERFLDRCGAGDSGDSFVARLRIALQKAEAPRPTPVEATQALCRWSVAMGDDGLRQALEGRLPEPVGELLSQCDRVRHPLARGIEARPPQPPDPEGVVEATVPAFRGDKVTFPDDQEVAAVTETVLAVMNALSNDDLEDVRTLVREFIHDLQVAQEILAVDTWSLPQYAAAGGDCDTPKGLFAYGAHLRDPAITVSDTGSVELVSSVVLVLCRGSDTTGGRFWDFALVEDGLVVDLTNLSSTLDPTDDTANTRTAVEASLASLTVDRTAIRAMADAKDASDVDLFAEPIRQMLPDLGIRLLFDPAEYPHRFAVSIEESQAVVRMHPYRADDGGVCIVAPISPERSTDVEGCRHVWDDDRETLTVLQEFQDHFKKTSFDRLWPAAVQELKPLAGQAFVDALVGWQPRFDDAAVSLHVGVAGDVVTKMDVEELLKGAPPERFSGSRVKPADLSGFFSVSADVTADASWGRPRILQRPAVVLDRLLRREFEKAVDEQLIAIAAPTGRADCIELSFGSAAPLAGRLGSLCWSEADLTYKPPEGAVIETATGGWRLEAPPSDEWSMSDGTLAFTARVTAGVEDAWGFRGDTINVSLIVDLANGKLELTAEGNDRILDHVRRRAGPYLPAGVGIDGLTLTADGFGVDLLDAGGRGYTVGLSALLDSTVRRKIEDWADQALGPRQDACAPMQAAALGQMLLDRSPPTPETQESLRKACGESIKTTGSLRIGDADALTWACQPSLYGDTFADCTVSLPQIHRYCRGIDFDVFVDGSGPRLSPADNALLCIRQSIDALVQGRLPVEIDPPDALTFDCRSPSDPLSCGFKTTVRLNLRQLFGDADGGADSPGSGAVELAFRVGLDGSFRLDARADEVLGDLVATAVELELVEAPLPTLDDLVEALPFPEADMREFETWLEALMNGWGGHTCHVVFPQSDPKECRAYLRLPAGDRRKPASVRLTKNVEFLGFDFRLVGELPAFDRQPRYAVECDSCAERADEVAEAIAERLARAAGSQVHYEGGATLSIGGGGIRLRLPLEIDVSPIPIARLPIEITCGIAVPDGRVSCDGEGIDEDFVRSVATEAIRKALDRVLPLEVPAGPFTFALEKAQREQSDLVVQGKILLSTGLDLGEVTATITLDRRVVFRFEEDLVTSEIETALRDQLNKLFGSFLPLEVTNVEIEKEGGLPSRVSIEMIAKLGDWFEISVPTVVLTADGLEVDGPREIRLKTSGVGVPAPPVVLCLTGGAVGPDRVLVTLEVVLDACTGDRLVPLHIDGKAEVSLQQPGRFEIDGTLVFLERELGRVITVLNLEKHYLETTVEIGGALSRFIAFEGNLRVEGDGPRGELRAEVRVFGTRLSEASIVVDIPELRIRATIEADLLGFISARGEFDSGSHWSAPWAGLEGKARVLGWTLAGLDLRARPRELQAVFNLLGLRLGIVLPGLDMLSPSVLVELILRLLIPDLTNLDQALLAILNGNLAMNPFADFGSGGALAIDAGDENDEDTDEDGRGDSEGEGAADTAAPTATADAERAGEASTGSALLNPEGRYRVEFAPEGEGYAISLMEGNAVHGQIAYAPQYHLTRPIFDPGRGRPLAFTEDVYTHVMEVKLAANGQPDRCKTNEVGPAVFTFTGRELPQVGYFELCRFGELSVDDLAREDWRALARAFLEEIARWPAERPRPGRTREGDPVLPGPERLLRSGWMGEVKDTRLLIGQLESDHLLVVADMRIVSGGACMAPATLGEERRSMVAVLHDPRQTGPLTGDDATRILPVLRALAGCDADMGGVYEVGSAADADAADDVEKPDVLLAAEGYLGQQHVVRLRGVVYEVGSAADADAADDVEKPDVLLAAEGYLGQQQDDGSFQLLREPDELREPDQPTVTPPWPIPAAVRAVLAAVEGHPDPPAPPDPSAAPEAAGEAGGATPASPGGAGGPGASGRDDGAGDPPSGSSAGSGGTGASEWEFPLSNGDGRVVFGADGELCAVWRLDAEGDSRSKITTYKPARFGGTCEPPEDASVAAGPDRVVVVGEKEGKTLLFHLGWNEAQEREISQQQSGSAGGRTMGAMVLRPVEGDELDMVDVMGFDGTGARGVLFDVRGDDDRRYLAWADHYRAGLLEIRVDLDPMQLEKLPGFMTTLGEDVFNCSSRYRGGAGSCRMDDLVPDGAGPGDGDADYRILRPRSDPPGPNAMPVLAWDTYDDAGSWRLAARLTERPDVDGNHRPELLSALAALIPREQRAADAWMFDLGAAVEHRWVGAAVGDRLTWGQHPEVLIPLDDAQMRKLCPLLSDVFDTGVALYGYAAFQKYKAVAQAVLPAAEDDLDLTRSEALSRVFSYLWTLNRRGLDGHGTPSCVVGEDGHDSIGALLRAMRPSLELAFSEPIILAGVTDLRVDDTCDQVAVTLVEHLHAETRDPDAAAERRRVLVDENGCAESPVYLLTTGSHGDESDGNESDGEKLRKIEVWGDGVFGLHAKFDGEPLPEGYLSKFLDHLAAWLEDETLAEEGRTFHGVSTKVFRVPAWTTRHPDSGDLHIFFEHAADQDVIEIRGRDLEQDDLAGLVRFVLDSRGDSFEVMRRANGPSFAVEVTTATDTWIVNFDDGQPKAWMALDADAVGGGGEVPVPQLADVLEMAHDLRPTAFEYSAANAARGPGLPFPMTWRSHKPGAWLLAVRPVADGPYLLIEYREEVGVGEEDLEWLAHAIPLCGSSGAVVSHPLLDLAERLLPDPDRGLPAAAPPESFLLDVMTVEGDDGERTVRGCTGVQPGLLYLAESRDRPGEPGLLYRLQEHQLGVAAIVPCEGEGCDVTMERTSGPVAERFAQSLVDKLAADVHTVDPRSPGIRLVHDEDGGEGSGVYALLYAWDDAETQSDGMRNVSFVYGHQVLEPRPGAPHECVLDPGKMSLRPGEGLDTDKDKRFWRKLAGRLRGLIDDDGCNVTSSRALEVAPVGEPGNEEFTVGERGAR